MNLPCSEWDESTEGISISCSSDAAVSFVKDPNDIVFRWILFLNDLHV